MKKYNKQKGTTVKVASFLKDVLERTENKSLVLGDTIFNLTKTYHISNSYSTKLLVNMGILEMVNHEKTKYYKKIIPDNITDDEINSYADKLHQAVYEYKRASKAKLNKKREAEANVQQTEIDFKNDTAIIKKDDDVNYPTLLDQFKETVDQLNLEKVDLQQELEKANNRILGLRKRVGYLTNLIEKKNLVMDNIEAGYTVFTKLFIENAEEFRARNKTHN